MRTKVSGAGLALGLLLAGASYVLGQQEDWQVPRTSDGQPDLSGTYDTATLTPLQRPRQLGNKRFLTAEEAQALADEERTLAETLGSDSDPERHAPPSGGDGSPGPYGNVGGYNFVWIDRGTEAFELDGRYRTSIVVDPENGRLPEMTREAAQRVAERRKLYRENSGDNQGEAWWLEIEGPGPYDNPEQRPLAERCLLGFGSTSGPPSLPVLYNNLKRIVQTKDYVMILVEMVHDARIIRLTDGDHPPGSIRKWMGDSIGHWEGDTLVVETANFVDTPGLFYATGNLRVVERFTRTGPDQLLYQFTVEDPSVWTAPWSGEYPWVATDAPIYEYACHEANYSFESILKGARVLESEALQKKSEPQ